MREYPTYEELRASRLSARRADACRLMVAIEERAAQLDARIVVFGSLVEGGFDERSDIDVAIFGLPPGRDQEVAIEIEASIAAAGFSADVIAERFLPAPLRDRIDRHGKRPSDLG
jgi:predicted nucleotidyltransferase